MPRSPTCPAPAVRGAGGRHPSGQRRPGAHRERVPWSRVPVTPTANTSVPPLPQTPRRGLRRAARPGRPARPVVMHDRAAIPHGESSPGHQTGTLQTCNRRADGGPALPAPAATPGSAWSPLVLTPLIGSPFQSSPCPPLRHAVLTPLIPSPCGRGETQSDRRSPSPHLWRGGQGVRTMERGKGGEDTNESERACHPERRRREGSAFPQMRRTYARYERPTFDEGLGRVSVLTRGFRPPR